MMRPVLEAAVKIVPMLALASALVGFAGVPIPRFWRRALAWSVVPVLALKCLAFNPTYLADFTVFYHAGVDVRAGRDPYFGVESPDRLPMFNPPTALPLFVALSMPPYPISGAVWMVVSVAGTLVLVEASRRALNAAEDRPERRIPVEATANLMPALALAAGSRTGLTLGQLHVWVALGLIAAFWARGRRRPGWAGLALALASVKPQTCLPFFLLFRRRSDLPAWIASAAVGFGLCVSVFPIRDWPREIREMTTRIEYYSRPGMINDYSYQNPNSRSLVNLEQLAHALGARDRETIHRAQWLLLGMIGAGLVYEVGWRRRISESGACALVASFTMIFLYHRAYDAVVLAPALVYVAAGARRSAPQGTRRRLCAASGMAMLAALNPYEPSQAAWLARSWSLGVAGWFVRAFAVPYPTWAALIALGGVWLAARREANEAGES